MNKRQLSLFPLINHNAELSKQEERELIKKRIAENIIRHLADIKKEKEGIDIKEIPF